VVPFFCGGVGGAAAGRGFARAAAPSATISGARFVVDADFAKRRSFALSPIFRLGRLSDGTGDGCDVVAGVGEEEGCIVDSVDGSGVGNSEGN